MGRYLIIGAQQTNTGLEVTIDGPGISNGGVIYWFANDSEAHGFIDSLNASYFEARRFAKLRRSAAAKGMTATLRSSNAAASHNQVPC